MSTNTARQAKRQKTDDDSSAAAEDDRNNASSPTGRNLLLVLCRIDDTDTYSTDDVNKALDKLGTWAECNDTDERARISKEFIDLGGIPRIIKFIQGNKDNVVFMLRASKVIKWFLYPGDVDENLEHASTMAQKFIEHEGVEMMLSIIKEKYTGELEIDQLETLDNIFSVFSSTMWNMNKKNMVDIDKFLPIIDVGMSTLAILSNINTHDDAAVALIKENIFSFFAFFVHYNAEMIDAVDFHEKNIFPKCVRALKDPVDNSWKYDKKAWGYASSFFYECCMENREILSRKNDFKVIIPFCIRFMKEDPDHSSASGVVDLLREASDIIGKKKMITSNKGLLEELGTIVYCGNDTVSNDVKEKAMNLMGHFFGES